ncbi:unnamed protein product [Cylicocyclus nassatus]|uniref:Uncharacterized protein n=1 Tax=Cylicocyclus nassatus TaxID=53992 RepID=A0AA36MBZ1_CYLNA|nr:unnamed protein product [Cylicocyclus nassatus]
MKESAGIFTDPEVVSQSPVSLWRNVVQTYPSLPLWTIAFILLLCIEIRLFFCAWYKIAWRSNEDGGEKAEKHPPSYAYCISQGTSDVCSADDLPSYEEAVRRSSVQKPCCSKSLLPRTDSSRTNLKASDSAQNEAQTPVSGNAKAQLKTQVQSYPQTNTNVSRITSSRPRPQRVVAIQIEQPPVETERR